MILLSNVIIDTIDTQFCNPLYKAGIANGPTSRGGYREGGKLRGGLAG